MENNNPKVESTNTQGEEIQANASKNLLENTQSTKNPLLVYLAIGVVVFLIIIGLFLNFFSSKEKTLETQTTMSFDTQEKSFVDKALGRNTQESGILDLEQKETNESLGGVNTCYECNGLEGKAYENCMQQKGCPFIPKSYNTPKIYKFGSVMVAQNTDNSNANGDSGSNLALHDKPQTVLEFGQNGGGVLNNSILKANMDLVNGSGGGLGAQGGSSVGRGEGNRGEVYSPSAANFSAFNPSLLLTKGTYIGCSLKTRLVSEIKGGIACIISNDVYSSNGHTLLIEKGSLVSGTYSNEGMDDGSNRIYVIWQEIRTPNNIVIPVFSGASDTLGGAGIEGYVDHHYFKRFGSAILVSLIDDVMGAVTTRISRQTSGNYYDYSENTREGISDLASETLKKMIDIKPTLYKNHGDIVGIYVNKDIDFSKVYTLRSKK